MIRSVRRPSTAAPRVEDGRVQRRNHRDVSGSGAGPVEIRVDVPAAGDRHFMGFERVTAAAYQLLHVFLHELWHHVDAITLPARGATVRGEADTEVWANRCADRI